MITRLLIYFTLGLAVAYAQPIDVSEHLVRPVNPPIGPSSPGSTSSSIDAKALAKQISEVAHVQADLKAALDNGLAENHPTIKSLRAKLAVLQSQIAVTKAVTPESPELRKLRTEMETMKKDSKQDQDLLLSEMANIKTAIEQLRDEIATLKKK